MRTFEEIRTNYRLGEDEEDMLRRLAPVVETQADQVVDDFYQFLQEIPYTAKFLEDPERLARVKNYHRSRAPITRPIFSGWSASAWPMCASGCRPISSMWP
jgi:hypothetical protein